MKLGVFLPTIIITPACATDAAIDVPDQPVLVEFWTGGDDGLTQRLAVEVRSELEQSPAFRLAGAHTPGALVVRIPTHVGWRRFDRRTRVTYQLEIDRAGRRLTRRSGNCWESDLALCARQIIRSIRRAATL